MFDVRDKPKMVERAYLVGVRHPDENTEEIEHLLEELSELVRTLSIGVIGQEIVRLRQGSPRLLLGSGKAAEVVERAQALKADCLVFDTQLSPAQQRNWETLSGCCVIDRQEVILDIFSERARTREAVLQVDLARSEHALPRLKNAWTHLSRQRGGGGVTQRGEGEAQIELDQRMVRERISRLKKELAAVIRHREVQRKQRHRVPIPTAAIVGYTNAGKSTLLNALTGSNVLSEDKLFATLDPTTRQLILPQGKKLLVTDTVGFVRRLPHQLVDAFKATLEEAVVADFLIHVLDSSSPDMEAHRETTTAVMKELGAVDKPILTVLNKVDRIAPENRPEGSRDPNTFYISAATGEGLGALLNRCEDLVSESDPITRYLIPYTEYGLVHDLHEAGAIREEKDNDDGVLIKAQVPPRLKNRVAPYTIE